MDWIALAALIVSACSLGVTIWALRKVSGSEHEQRLHNIEKELGTVDSRVMIACHERVRRDPEFRDLRTKVENFIDTVNRSGVLK